MSCFSITIMFVVTWNSLILFLEILSSVVSLRLCVLDCVSYMNSFCCHLNLLILFGRNNILCVILLCVSFRLLNICFKILSDFLSFGNPFSIGLFLDSLVWADSIKEVCRLMKKLADLFCKVTTVLLSDLVLLMAGIDSSSFLSGSIKIVVVG